MTDTLPEFSASRFNLYKTCPRLYRYQYIDHLEGNRHVYTLMGSALHLAIEHYYKTKENPLPLFTNNFHELMAAASASENGVVAGNLLAKAVTLGQSILRGMDWGTLEPKEIEFGFRLPFPAENPLVIMRGFIDMITEDEWIVDHKSGGKKPSSVELANNPQLLIYVWAYEQLYGHKPKRVIWHHLRTLELCEAKVMDDYDAKLEKLTKTLVSILTDTAFEKIPEGYFCKQVCAHNHLCWPRQTDEESLTFAGDS